MADAGVIARPQPAPERVDPASPRPVSAGERFFSMDVLRGFALLGILVPNMFAFAWPQAAMVEPNYMGEIALLANPLAPIHDTANTVGFDVMSTVFLGKFMFMFSLLFGAGVIFFDRKYDRAQPLICTQCRYILSGLVDSPSATVTCPECGHTGQPEQVRRRLSQGAGLWYARMGWLLAIGLVHAFGLWFGDILVWYALTGLTLLWWIRRWSPRTLLISGASLYVFGALLIGAFTAFGLYAVSAGKIGPEDLVGDYQTELEVYRDGTYLQMFTNRAVTLAFMYIILLPLGMIWMTAGIMTVGMGVTKLGVLTGERSSRFYATLAGVGLGVGLPITLAAYYAIQNAGWDQPGVLWRTIAQPIGVLQAFGFVGLMVLLAKTPAARAITVPLAAVGRMALSNYLLHTLICTTLFYAYGLGLFGEVQFPALAGVMVSVWIVNIVFSLIWLRVFRFGPAEWVWRSLTYLRPQPLLKARC